MDFEVIFHNFLEYYKLSLNPMSSLQFAYKQVKLIPSEVVANKVSYRIAVLKI